MGDRTLKRERFKNILSQSAQILFKQQAWRVLVWNSLPRLKKTDWELLALLASFLGKNASWGQPCVWKLSLKEQLGFPPGKQVKGKFPLQGHVKTKAKISIWLMTSPPQLWKSSNIRRLVAAAEFGVTSVGADVGEVQPDTQTVPYKVHPPPPSATTPLLTSLPLLFHLPPPQTAHLLSHNPPGVGSLRTMPMGGETPNRISCCPPGGRGRELGRTGLPLGSTGPVSAKTTHPRHSPLQRTVPLQRSRPSKWFQHPHAAVTIMRGAGFFSQMAMYCI